MVRPQLWTSGECGITLSLPLLSGQIDHNRLKPLTTCYRSCLSLSRNLLTAYHWSCLSVSFSHLPRYEKNSIHTASLSHLISLVHLAHHLILYSHGWLLDSHKCWLFRLHIQHFTCCLFEQQNQVGSLEAAVCGFYLSISPPPPIWWSHRWQPGAGLLHLVFLRGNGTSSLDDSSAEVSSVAYALFTSWGSMRTSWMVIILALGVESSLSLSLSEVFKPIMGHRSTYMMGHPVDKDLPWADHTCNMFACIKGHTMSIWGLHPDTSPHVVSYLLLFRLIWRECIDTF